MFDARRAFPPDSTISTVAARDGWPLRRVDVPARGGTRGAILWCGGRGDMVEKYLETLNGWADAGWTVTSFDWRGQGGSGRLSANPHVGHVTDFAVWIDDLADVVRDWQAAARGPHVVMGHSMGGHLVLRAIAERRIAPDAAVLVAPMLGFDAGVLPLAVASGATRLLARVMPPTRPAWRANEKPSLPGARRQRFLTHDAGRYADEIWWQTRDPELKLGPPSWQWLAAAYASNARLANPGVLEAVTTPMLIVATQGDKLVSAAAIRAAAARLPNATLKLFPDTVAHEILRETDAVRDEALRDITAFLGQVRR